MLGMYGAPATKTMVISKVEGFHWDIFIVPTHNGRELIATYLSLK